MAERIMAQVLVAIDADTVLAGARRVKTALVTELGRQNLADRVLVIETGTIGPTGHGVVVGVYPHGEIYGNLTEETVPEFVRERFIKGRPVAKLLLPVTMPSAAPPADDSRRRQYYGRIVLENCGRINPEDIEEYIGAGGYQALGTALSEKTPAEVTDIIRRAGLRGRGGAGFPTALKWSFAAAAAGTEKYVICNADEGEPGTFKDRLIMEGDPHRVIEGMAIAGYAIGARTGYIYIRGEYRLSVERMAKAVRDAENMGLLGRNLFGSGFDFTVRIRLGAGSYVCGEETALINSMEGRRGEPRLKPPFPAEVGFLNRPTNVNNVETLANVPPIVVNGPDWFRRFGTPETPGTKVYTVLGHINRPGLVEVPMGVTLREILNDYGGGMSSGSFKMAQLGGTAGDLLPPAMLDVPLAFESLQAVGHNLGSGAILIMNESVSTADFLACCLKFFVHESCGHCSVCRLGTRRLHEAFERLKSGSGYLDELSLIETLAVQLRETAFCPMGQSVAAPVLSGLRYFRAELERGVAAGLARPRRKGRGGRSAGQRQRKAEETAPAG